MATPNPTMDINCDMGESYGIYRMGNDEDLMRFITQANIACGFHASDPNHMRRAVELAKQYKVSVGAHVSLPDLNGFGRREMSMETEELFNGMLYQIGALKSFTDFFQVPLTHVKPHGALYGMAAKSEAVAECVAEAAGHYRLAVFGLPGTMHEKVYRKKGLAFKAEFFADLEYDAEGGLIITRKHESVSPELAVQRCLKLVCEQTVVCNDGSELSLKADTVCIHSDTPNAVEIAKAVRDALKPHLRKQ